MARLRHVLGNRIRLLRLTRGWSQEVLGELAGIDRTYIGAIENGRNNVSVDNIEKLAAALGVSPHRLMVNPDEELASMSCPLAVLIKGREG